MKVNEDINEIAKRQFKQDFIKKTLVQEKQFELWLRMLFFLNEELSIKYDFVYQNEFYIKLNEVFTVGINYSVDLLNYLKKGNNINKQYWFEKFIKGIEHIKQSLTEKELDYIEYKRHNVCHIFQDAYEHIQKNLKIKKEKNGRSLEEINNNIKELLLKFDNDKNIDLYLNNKLQSQLKDLYEELK